LSGPSGLNLVDGVIGDDGPFFLPQALPIPLHHLQHKKPLHKNNFFSEKEFLKF
jgi:hypothetical protein